MLGIARSMFHRCTALTAVLAAGALAAPALAADGPAVKGDGFTTTLPSGWMMKGSARASVAKSATPTLRKRTVGNFMRHLLV